MWLKIRRGGFFEIAKEVFTEKVKIEISVKTWMMYEMQAEKNVKLSRQRELKSTSHLQTLEESRSLLVEQKTHCSQRWGGSI